MRAHLLLSASLLLGLQTTAQSRTDLRHDLEVVRLAWQIWFPTGRKPELNQPYQELKKLVARSDWAGAIEYAEKLTPRIPKDRPDYLKEQPWEWQVAIAELHVLAGNSGTATALLDYRVVGHS